MSTNAPSPGYYDSEFDTQVDSASEGSQLFDINALRRMLWRQRRILIVCTLVGALIGLFITLLITPIFQARSTIRIEARAMEVVEGGQLDPYYDLRYYDRYANTLSAVLTSRQMAEEVAENLNVVNDPAFFERQGVEVPTAESPALTQKRRLNVATGMLSRNVSMTNERDNNIAYIEFRSEDPELAAEIANTYAASFVTNQATRRSSSYDYARKALEQQIAETRDLLTQSERESLAYASRNRIVDAMSPTSDKEEGSSGTASLVAANLVATNSQFSEARNRRILAEERWKAAQVGNFRDLPEAAGNPQLQTLLSQQAELRAEIAQLGERYLPGHPELAERQEQLEAINSSINSVGSNLRNSLRNEYQVALGQEQELSSDLNRLAGATLDEQAKRVQLGILNRDVEANRYRLSSLLDRLGELESAADITANNVEVIDQARTPSVPVSPDLMKNLLISIAAGLAVAVALALLRELLDDTIYSPEEAEARLMIPLMGTIPLVGEDEPLDDMHSEIGEAYSSLSSAVDVATSGRANKVIAITSSKPGEGKTTTSCALAQDFARAGRRVLLVDCDVRRPSVHRWFAGTNKRGFVNVLVAREDLESNLLPTNIENLSVLPSGPIPTNPAQMLSTDAVPEFISAMRERFDIVIIDSPPIMGLADAPRLSRHVDAVVMVVEAASAHYSTTRKALRRLRSAGANVLGMVVTKFNFEQPGYGYGYQYYRYNPRGSAA